MRIRDDVYDILKWITTIVLPALGTLYFALSGIWGLPYGEQIVGTITAIVTCLGVILGISTYNYNHPAEPNENKDKVDQMAAELSQDYLGERFFVNEDGDPIEKEG